MTQVIVYGTDYCPYCRKSELLLQANNIHYDYISVDNDPKKREEIAQRSGMKTVPQIFINGISIGGYDHLYALESNGKLADFLSK